MKYTDIIRRSLGLLILTISFAANAVTPNFERDNLAKADRWADSVYSTLSLRERIAQLLFPKINPAQGQASKAAISRLIGKYGCGGLLFSSGSLAEHIDMNRYAASVAKVPPLISFDGEWGLAMRASDSPRFPENMTLGAITDYRLIYEYGREIARECRLAGINVNFAPDADINSNPSNPVIGFRSFGEDPVRVAKASTAYSLGLEDGGVQSVAKHFPGHGDTNIDSHEALPSIDRTIAQLDSVELVPFKDYIDAGCSGIMVGHLAVNSLDPSGSPASLSPVITDQFLRKKLGFSGLVYTDALGMKGTSGSSENVSLAALKAGADVLLSPLNPISDITAIEKAVRDKDISDRLIEDRCKRILRYKYLLNARKHPVNSVDSICDSINLPEAKALIVKLCDASVTIIKNEGGILPVNTTNVSVVNIGAPQANTFSDICSHYADIASKNPDVVIAAVYNDRLASRQALEKLAREHSDIVAVFFINPYKIAKFADITANLKAVVLAYENLEPMQQSAAQAFFGGINVSGRLPVGIKGIARVGTGIDLTKTRLGFSSPVAQDMHPWLTDSIDTVVGKLIRDGGMPGCQVLVAKNGYIIFDKSFGHLSTVSGPKVNRQTIYDLASVSKAVGTLPGIMKSYEKGLLALDDSIAKYIPQITDSAKRRITVRELLYHESAMPASLNMFDIMFDKTSYTGKLISPRRSSTNNIKIQNRAWGNRWARLRRDILSSSKSDINPVEAAGNLFTGQQTYDTIMQRIYDIPLRQTKEYNYSCLNFCLLMDIEQRLTGISHDQFVGQEIFGPLGAYRTGYRPRTWTDPGNIAPTEHDTYLRRQTLKGYVHDELAAFSGGVQGNAGLFGNADDIAKYCQMLLNGGSYGGKQILQPETTRLFTTDKSSTCRRGLGFDKPDIENPDYSPTCDEASPQVFGHLGFTGTVFWVDPTHDLIFVFLTNRVYPTRDSAVFNRSYIRAHLFSLVYRALQQ